MAISVCSTTACWPMMRRAIISRARTSRAPVASISGIRSSSLIWPHSPLAPGAARRGGRRSLNARSVTRPAAPTMANRRVTIRTGSFAPRRRANELELPLPWRRDLSRPHRRALSQIGRGEGRQGRGRAAGRRGSCGSDQRHGRAGGTRDRSRRAHPGADRVPLRFAEPAVGEQDLGPLLGGRPAVPDLERPVDRDLAVDDPPRQGELGLRAAQRAVELRLRQADGALQVGAVEQRPVEQRAVEPGAVQVGVA